MSNQPESAWCVGVDLAQTTDHTAICVAEIVPSQPVQVLVRHLERLPKQTPYPVQVEIIGGLIERVKERGRVLAVCDQTGVGRPVVDMFRIARLGVPMWPVTIATSAMGQAKRDPTTGDFVVPKKDLIGAAITLMHGGQMKVAAGLPPQMVRVFREELAAFRMKITAAANVTYEAWRENDSDDLVLAVSLVAWAAQRWAKPGGLI